MRGIQALDLSLSVCRVCACVDVCVCVFVCRSLLGFGCFSRLALCGLVGAVLSAQGPSRQGSRGTSCAILVDLEGS